MSCNRFDRNELFFGKEGQKKLRDAIVAVVGIGGLGLHVVQQLSFKGVGTLILIDDEELDGSNKNRYVGSFHDDPVPGTRKVDVGARLAHSIDPEIKVIRVFNTMLSDEAFAAMKRANYVFGCVDNDGSRFVINEFSQAYCLPYIDLASDILPGEPIIYGGRIAVSWYGNGCLHCMDILDMEAVKLELESPDLKRQREEIYGVSKASLSERGPSVVSINGVVASQGVVEFMAGVTGLREPFKLINYRGHLGTMTVSKDAPASDCYYCKVARGMREKAGVERYIKKNVAA